jgi:nucleotide-binding universal stress UspA family protein
MGYQIHTNETGYQTLMKEIIVGYDGSAEAERALVRAADIAEAFSSQLVVASITNYPAATAMAPVAPTPIATRSPESGKLAERELEQARASLAGRSVQTEYVTEVGDPAGRLLELAERRDADLIVVGSREHGFLEHVLGMSCDEKVARRAHTDVMLVH